MTPSSAWACGTGGADCTPIQQGGPCSHPADSNQGHSNRKFQSSYDGKSEQGTTALVGGAGASTADLTSKGANFAVC
ncbi:hypothetical protein L2E82_30024 [Cichorium intybus]|uniref:Uncharacterized protein n=1 Tax=Cichorium intybus TaxID=13427 RepID=A0ACB9CZE3_CICIN|nr:hypothetical protein L2E82_30024 [Cichorium intybus]